MRLILFLFLSVFLCAKDFKVATYNVENLFDTEKNGYEYQEYIAGTHNWNQKTCSIKLHNIAKVIKDLDADIIALQEVENKNILKLLNVSLGKQKYPYFFISNDKSTTQVALLSRFKIINSKSLKVVNFPRAIHKTTLLVEGKELVLYLNHWPSKKYRNSMRKVFATVLFKDFKKEENEYIILGDFNAPFKEAKRNWGESLQLLKQNTYPLWYELPWFQRYSHVFFHSKKALDSMFIANSLVDGKNIEYKSQSFSVFAPKYLFDAKGNVLRWQISQKGKGRHLGKGFSDHLPLSAFFQTNNYVQKPSCSYIQDLKKLQDGKVNFLLCKVHLTKKDKKGFFVEDSMKDTIYIYRPDFWLERGKIYNLHVKFLGTYKGKREILLFKEDKE
jgi:endonuclease/exonuclease/phosphatase family metal-dependent hydrolase